MNHFVFTKTCKTLLDRHVYMPFICHCKYEPVFSYRYTCIEQIQKIEQGNIKQCIGNKFLPGFGHQFIKAVLMIPQIYKNFIKRILYSGKQ